MDPFLEGGGFSGGYQPQEPQARLPQPPEQVPLSPQAADVAQQYQQNQEEFKRRQAEIESRKQDLVLAERMSKLMDPRVPKPARQFLYDELSRTSGVDPKGETSRSVGKMLMGLDPEALEGLGRNFAAKLKDAKPGEIKQLIQSVLTGQMSGMELLKVAQAGPAAPSPASPLAGAAPPPPPPAAPAPPPTQTPPSAMPPDVTPPTVTQPPPITATGEEVKRRRLKTVGETPAPYGIVEPGLLKSLGLDYSKPVRHDDLAKMGFAVPQDAKEQRELAKEMDQIAAGTVDVAVNAARVHQLFAGKPEVLGAVGATARTIDQAMDQIKGIAQVAGVDLSKTPGPGEAGLKSLAVSAASRVQALYRASGIEHTAVESAKLQGAILDMAYSMAVARGIPGNRLTNAIIAQHLNTLGHSQSVAQFESTLADATARATERSARQMASRVGGAEWQPNFSFASMSDLETMASASGMLPKGIRDNVAAEVQKRLDVAQGKPATLGKPVTRQEPTLETEQADVAKEEAQRQRHLDFAESREKDRLAMEKERDQRAARGETRAEARAKEQTEHTRFMENMAIRREARLENQQKKDKIGEAFVKLGQMIGHGSTHQISAGSGGGGGGDQDAGAFRIAPPPRRQAPQPVDASRYQRGKKGA